MGDLLWPAGESWQGEEGTSLLPSHRLRDDDCRAVGAYDEIRTGLRSAAAPFVCPT